MKKFIIFIIFAVIISGSGFIYFSINKKSPYETITARRNSFVREVFTNGKVVAPEKVDLQFKNSGKLIALNIKVGDRVETGEILAEQNAKISKAKILQMQAGIETAIAQLANYQAAFKAQQAKLDELKKGTRPEEITVYETKLSNAEVSLEDAKRNLIDKLQDAYTKSDDSVRNKVDQYFNNPRGSSPTLVFTANGSQDVENTQVTIEYILTSWKSSLDKLTISSDLGSYLDSAKSNLNQIKSFLEKNALILNSLTASADLSQTIIDTYRSAVSTARTNVNTAITNLQVAEGTLSSAESDALLAEKNLALAKAGSLSEQITAQEAQVEQAKSDIALQKAKIRNAEALLQEAEAQIQELAIVSPAVGIITAVNGKMGEIIEPQKVFISLIPDSNLEIKLDVSEMNIAEVEINQEVRITLDAFGKDIEFIGKITKIDPAETVISEAIYYKTTVLLEAGNKQIRPGMNANAWIKTQQKENALLIPAIAVKEKDGKKYVDVLEGNQVKQKKVKTGLKGKEGMIEIIDGINEGEEVIIGDKK